MCIVLDSSNSSCILWKICNNSKMSNIMSKLIRFEKRYFGKFSFTYWHLHSIYSCILYTRHVYPVSLGFFDKIMSVEHATWSDFVQKNAFFNT